MPHVVIATGGAGEGEAEALGGVMQAEPVSIVPPGQAQHQVTAPPPQPQLKLR